MKGFGISEGGDTVIRNQEIQMIADEVLTGQKIRQVLRTNRGEWWLDSKEGVSVQTILKKNPDKRQIRDHIRRAVKLVDASLELEQCDFKTEGRTLQITLTVRNGNRTILLEMEA